MRDLKAREFDLGFLLQGKRGPSVDLRFADDILLVADSTAHCVAMLRSHLDSLREVGLILSVSET